LAHSGFSKKRRHFHKHLALTMKRLKFCLPLSIAVFLLQGAILEILAQASDRLSIAPAKALLLIAEGPSETAPISDPMDKPSLMPEINQVNEAVHPKSTNQAGASRDNTPDEQAGSKVNHEPGAVDELGPELAKKLQDLETHFFGHVYANEAVNRRVVRLERFVFGTESGGPYSIRLNHVAGSLNLTDPDGTKHEVKLRAKETPQPEPNAQLPKNPQPQENPETSSGVPNVVQGQDQYLRPQQLAVPNMDKPALSKSSELAPSQSQSEKPNVLVLQVSKETFSTLNKPGDMIKELDLAIRLHPLDPDLMFERAKAFIQIDKLSSALNDLSDAIQNNPNKSAYYLARAWCYKKLGNSYLAADDIKQARFVDPSLPPQINLLQNTLNFAPQHSE